MNFSNGGHLFSQLLVVLLILTSSCSSVLYLAPKQVDCTGVGDQKCLLIRNSPEGNWILHYGKIDGLDYEPGFSYKVKVKKERIKNPPADGSSIKYNLIEILEKRDVTDDMVAEDLIGKEWELEFLVSDGIQYGFEEQIPTMQFTSEENVAGNSGCNRYTGPYALDGRTFKFGNLAVTKMMCQQSQELESAFLKVLGLELRGLFDDGKLVLTADGGNKMVFHLK